jgi:hypothetical protein
VTKTKEEQKDDREKNRKVWIAVKDIKDDGKNTSIKIERKDVK